MSQKNISIQNQIKEFIRMGAGVHVSNPGLRIPITEHAQFTRKSLKHFVESRLRHGNSYADILYLVERAPEVISEPQLYIPNHNKTYPGSFLLGRFYGESGKAVIVILDRADNIKNIISLHFKNKNDFYRLLHSFEKSPISVGGGAAYPS